MPVPGPRMAATPMAGPRKVMLAVAPGISEAAPNPLDQVDRAPGPQLYVNGGVKETPPCQLTASSTTLVPSDAGCFVPLTTTSSRCDPGARPVTPTGTANLVALP